MPNAEPPACPSAAASQKPVAKNSSSPGSAAAGCAGNASLGRRFCNFAQSSSHNNGTAFGRMLCCKLRSSTSGGNYTLLDSLNERIADVKMQINRRFDDYPRLRACFHGRAQNFEVNFIERRLSATAVFRFETFSVARK